MAMRQKFVILTLAAILAMGFSADAFARLGGGGSFGSRGGRTFSAPPSTSIAPGGAAPLQRAFPNQNFSRQPMFNQGGGLLSGGFGRGLLGGLVGAGLLGMLFGNGFFGGLGGGMSLLGLILQIGLLYLLFRFVMGFIRNRQPAVQNAYSGGSASGESGQGPRPFAGSSGAGAGAGRNARLELGPADFSTFEQRLASIQKAYSAEDLGAAQAMMTPEMASYFAEEIAANARKGLVNKISDVVFLQGDLAEAWRENGAEYATVAMRFSLIDAMLQRSTGQIVSGSATVPQQVTEIWTFARRPGDAPNDWRLSAIQQAA